ncbi:MAG TPA: SDR family oxidoreductase [Bryobacteraceae bacterium]|nr:SDR family oxidoreductase [Bryobacteraceae bacterium]
MDNDKPAALVTGASSGIGATFARRLARDGYRLIVVARRRERLESLARELGNAESLTADLTNDEQLARVEDRIAQEPRLELLVNNAGFGTVGRFFEIPVEGQDQMHRLHVMATMRLSHAALRAMVPRGRGAVINVSSVAGFGNSPKNVSYCATKAWMNCFTEGLNLDLKSAGSPVKVQCLCPGFTLSEFHDVIQMDRGNIPGWLWTRAEDVVDASLRGLARGKLFVVPGGFYKTLALFQRSLPLWARTTLATLYGKREVRKAGGVKEA